jgi:hypothetical protein
MTIFEKKILLKEKDAESFECSSFIFRLGISDDEHIVMTNPTDHLKINEAVLQLQ